MEKKMLKQEHSIVYGGNKCYQSFKKKKKMKKSSWKFSPFQSVRLCELLWLCDGIQFTYSVNLTYFHNAPSSHPFCMNFVIFGSTPGPSSGRKTS